MSEIKLPPLPVPFLSLLTPEIHTAWAMQMRAYAIAAIEADRQARTMTAAQKAILAQAEQIAKDHEALAQELGLREQARAEPMTREQADVLLTKHCVSPDGWLCEVNKEIAIDAILEASRGAPESMSDELRQMALGDLYDFQELTGCDSPAQYRSQIEAARGAPAPRWRGNHE